MGSILTAILVLSALVLVHELGHFFAARRLGVGVLKFSIGFGPRVWGVKRGQTEYAIAAFPLGGFVKMVGEHDEEPVPAEGAYTAAPTPPPDPATAFENKPVWARMIIVTAGPVANLLFAVAVFWVVFMAGVPTLLTEIGTVQPNFPAADAGLRAGDVVAAIDGKPVETWDELTAIVHASAGVSREFTVRRGGETLALRITPRTSPSRTVFGESTTVGLVGITPAERFATRRYGPLAAGWQSLRRTGEIMQLTLVGIVKIFQRIVPAESIGGPIMIVQMAGQQAQLGAMNLVFFSAFLSISLGLFNLFPIPVLDGGQIWFLLAEAIRGRPLSRRVREIVQQIGLGLLVLLMLFAFYNDISRIATGNRGF
ncbi:MAG TPA: RIP metalloprotease RseP [Candidatus Methanoperedens sp.]|nr:RIP metalloprotease RseP [Candidatus Methanoperedens sp.]